MRRAHAVVPVLLFLVAAAQGTAAGCGTGTDVASGPGGPAPAADADPTGGALDGSSTTDSGSPATDSAVADACRDASCGLPPCSAGKETAIAGSVRAPNGVTPIYNAIVYIPTAPVAPLADGVVCDRCGAVPSGAPIATTLTDAAGSFVLKDVPPGFDVPIVVQIGKWRRQAKIPSVPRCETTVVLPETIRLPRNKSEGSMPHIAVTTGCDAPGCSLKKIGIDQAEFGTTANPSRAVHIFQGGGFMAPTYPVAEILWSDVTLMKTYDQIIFSSECAPYLETKGIAGAGAFQAVTEYLAAGGRILTTGSMYNWYKLSSDPALASVGVIPGDTLGQVLPWNIHLGVDFSKGKAVTDWLQGVFPTMTKGVVGEFSPVWKSITSIDGTKAQVWGIGPLPTPQPRIFSVNTPAGVPLTAQCGKGVHIDAHVNRVQGTEGIGFTFPADPYCTAPMKPTDAMFTFFLFDSASCIQRDRDTPVSPPTK